MSITAILAPVFALIALTFALHYWMGLARLSKIRRGEVQVRDIALGQPNWPARVTQIGNAFHNQLELPLLFYVLVAFALITRQADLLFVVMSWLFVALRMVHAFIFVTSNRVSHRFFAFIAGSAVLLLMWIIFAARVLPGA
jgi:hypothetical protein